MKIVFSVLLGLLSISSSVIAHEGHEEPKSMPAPKGGITRGNENFYFEYVYNKAGGIVYLYDHNAKPASTKNLKVSAVFEIPRKPNVSTQIITKDNSWELKTSLPKTHRITLKFMLDEGAHSDKMTFNVEPK